ncbi:hypothetical protein AZE42_02877, partial [Rhizopogon vesiculosus]
DPEEDRRNKPDRPLPAGRITTENAADVRWLLVPICLAFSAEYGGLALASSICFEALSIWYNDFGGHKTGLSKNLLTAAGYMFMEVGATIVAGSSPCIDSIGARAIIFSSAVFATTLHAQDFKDEEGDRLTGRRTLVTLFPTFARMSMMIGIPLWSFCLSRLWKMDDICSAAFVTYGMVIGARFMVYRNATADRQSCKLYSLWFTIAHLLPGSMGILSETHGRGAGSGLPLPVLLLAGISTLIAVTVSGLSIWLQLRNYRKPLLQRMVVRIMLMVPIYALASLISLFSLDAAFVIDVIRDIYEAFVIYCFFVLLVDYLGGERSLLIRLHGRPPIPAIFPVSLWRREVDVSDPYTFLFLKRGILQYVQVKPMLALASLIMKATGTYNEGDFRARSGYLYVSIVYNVSICLALYCLAVFWMCVSDDLKPFRPVPKFLCVKGILFFSFWQSIGISTLVAVGVITKLGPYTDSEHISLGLTDTLICVEMPFFAIAHMYAFSYRDFVKSSPSAKVYVARMRMGYALRDAFGLKDLAEDTKSTLRGEGINYRAFEPSEGGMHIGAARERRIRAGLRYSAGGKRKYWLPEVRGLGDRNAEGDPWLGRDRNVTAPLLEEDAEDVVHTAPDIRYQEQWRTIAMSGEDVDVEDDDEYALHFNDALVTVDDSLYEHAKKYVFGDYAYPVVDVSSEEARHVMWAEEERIVREGVHVDVPGVRRNPLGASVSGGYGATGTKVGPMRKYQDDEDEGFVSDERVGNFEEGNRRAETDASRLRGANARSTAKDGVLPPSMSSSSSSSASGLGSGKHVRPSGRSSRLDSHISRASRPKLSAGSNVN